MKLYMDNDKLPYRSISPYDMKHFSQGKLIPSKVFAAASDVHKKACALSMKVHFDNQYILIYL